METLMGGFRQDSEEILKTNTETVEASEIDKDKVREWEKVYQDVIELERIFSTKKEENLESSFFQISQNGVRLQNIKDTFKQQNIKFTNQEYQSLSMGAKIFYQRELTPVDWCKESKANSWWPWWPKGLSKEESVKENVQQDTEEREYQPNQEKMKKIQDRYPFYANFALRKHLELLIKKIPSQEEILLSSTRLFINNFQGLVTKKIFLSDFGLLVHRTDKYLAKCCQRKWSDQTKNELALIKKEYDSFVQENSRNYLTNITKNKQIKPYNSQLKSTSLLVRS
jgi:hypothetical protein